jgi:hypothetical protein
VKKIIEVIQSEEDFASKPEYKRAMQLLGRPNYYGHTPFNLTLMVKNYRSFDLFLKLGLYYTDGSLSRLMLSDFN